MKALTLPIIMEMPMVVTSKADAILSTDCHMAISCGSIHREDRHWS